MAAVQTILNVKGPNVVTADADEPVLSAALLMNKHGIGGVVVTEGGRVVGVFTERDVLRRVVAERRDPADTRLREVMTSPVISCRPDTDLDECRKLVTERRVRHLPVMQGDALVGIITSGDILAQQVRDQKEALDYLNSWAFDRS
jgi:CBS domain-containing protein